MRSLLSLLLALFPAVLPAQEGVPARSWAVLIQGNLAGEMTLRETVEDSTPVETWTFTYNDRGRGPDLTTRIEYPAGPDEPPIPTSIETTGHDYLKAPVEERFTRTDGVARWSNTDGEGEAELSGPAVYLSADSAAPEMAILARALRGAPQSTLPILPGGSARLEVLGTRKVGVGERKETLTHVAVSGLGFTPVRGWLDSEGRFFAAFSGWFSLVPEGWRPVAETLRSADEAAERDYFAALPDRLARRPGAVAVVGARVFDPETLQVTPGRTVVVEGGRIAAVGPDAEVKIPDDAERIDAEGKTLLPGLWDMHVHLTPQDGLLHLAAGVTSVRDLANDVDQATRLREAWSEGTALGPRVLLAGFLDGPGKYAGPTKALVDTKDEAREWIERYDELGYEQIKIYSSVDPELVPKIAAMAHERGLRVSGHVPQGLSASEAVDLGFDELQHVNFLFLNFWAHEEGLDTRTPDRFTTVAERAAEMDLESEEIQAFIRELAGQEIVVDPTVAIFESLFTTRPGEVQAAYAPVADRLPVQVRRGLVGGGLEPPEGEEQTYRESFRRMLDMVAALHEAGVPLVAGTDALAGFALHRELELYARAGIPNAEVLRIATLGAARVTGRADRLGTVEVGKLADLILVDGDPVEDLSDLRSVELVLKDGMVLEPAELYRALGVQAE